MDNLKEVKRLQQRLETLRIATTNTENSLQEL